MNKRNEGILPFKERALLSDADLAQYLSTGLTTARKISKEAGAVVYFGRCHDLQKVNTDMTDDLMFAQNRGLILTEVRIAWDYVQKAIHIQEKIEKEMLK